MWPRFGIKIGNSTLCIAWVKADGKPQVIANKQGDRTSQACFLWEGGDDIECGLTAKQKMATRPKQAVANSFQLLLPPQELTEAQVEAAIKEIPCEYDASSQKFQLKIATNSEDSDKECLRELSAFEVHLQLLRAELELARQYQGDETDEPPIVVLSIPSYYPESAWPLLAQAAEEAGFHVAQIVPEPIAAVLAYSVGEEDASSAEEKQKKQSDTKYVFTIKSGGLFSHFALYAVRNGLYSIMQTFGPFPVGGRQYTEALVQFICEEFQRKYKLDPHESRRSIAKIRATAANCKHILSTMPSTQVYIDSLMDGVDFNVQMSRARFESLIQPVIVGFMQTLGECVDRALQQHPETGGRIDTVVLLGATMQIPRLQAAIAARFPDAEVLSTLPSDEVVAMGCARQATFLTDPRAQSLKAAEECNCAESDLLIWHGDDESNAQTLVPKGAVLPTTVRLDVKASSAAAVADMFRLRTSDADSVHELSLKGASPTDEGVYRIEAEIGLMPSAEGEQQTKQVTPKTVVRLRCV